MTQTYEKTAFTSDSALCEQTPSEQTLSKESLSAQAYSLWQDEHTRGRWFGFTVDNAYDPVLITTADLDAPGPRIVYVNHAFTAMSGYEASEVIGQTPRLLQGPLTNREEMQRLRRDLEAGRPFVGEAINYAKGGREYFMEWTVYGLHNEAGALCFYVAIQRDITRRKHDEIQIENQTRQLAEANKSLAEANQRLAELSLTDNLTGLCNHRAMHLRLQEELARAKRYQTPFSVLMIDVDHFKAYNDAFGHPAGDEALQKTAQTLLQHSRENDVVARYGGEEFVVLLPQTDSSGALALAEQLRAAIEQTAWPLRGVTVSIGTATLKSKQAAGSDNGSELLNQADAALYASKSLGRNRITQAQN